MFISFCEHVLVNIQNLIEEYRLLGCRVVCGHTPYGACIVEFSDGKRQSAFNDPDSNSGIAFTMYKDLIHIQGLHTNKNHRREKMSEILLEPLIRYGVANNILKIRTVSANNNYWLHILSKNEYKGLAWEIIFVDEENGLSMCFNNRTVARETNYLRNIFPFWD